jgi:hypothetical protein
MDARGTSPFGDILNGCHRLTLLDLQGLMNALIIHKRKGCRQTSDI